jgi:hypothetical protein
MAARIREWIGSLRENPDRLFFLVILGIIFVCLLKSCIPGLGSDRLPAEVLDEITRSHLGCIKLDELQVRPGDYRQPECGHVNVDRIAQGSVPPGEAANGVTRAICFQVTIENPRWVTAGQTRHEVAWFDYSLYKVALLKDGKWQTFPNEDAGDAQRWLDFGCPGEYRGG